MAYSLTFAGQTFRIPTPEIMDRVRNFDWLGGLRDILPRQQVFPGPNLLRSGFPDPFKYPDVRIGDFFYPVGASRWSIFRGLMTAADVAAVLASLGTGNALGTFVIRSDGGDSVGGISTQLTILPPIPIVSVAGVPSVFLVDLVDERYFWHQQFSAGIITCTSLSSTSTWADLIAKIATNLSITVTYGSISSVYGMPEPDSPLYSSDESPAAMLDLVAANIGCVVVRNLNGSYQLQPYATGIAQVQANRPKSLNNLMGGQAIGLANPSPISGTILPNTVVVDFPQWVNGAGYYEPENYRSQYLDSYGQVYSVSVSISGLGLPYSDYETYPATKIFKDTAKALYSSSSPSGDPTNQTELAALAAQIAKDFYDARTAWTDELYAGIYQWTPEGVSDLLFRWDGQQVFTRAMAPPYNAGLANFQHGFGPLAAPEPTFVPVFLAWNGGYPVIGGPTEGPGIYFAIMQTPSPPSPPAGNFTPQIETVYVGSIATGSQTLTLTPADGMAVGQWYAVDQEVVQLTAVTDTSISAVFRNSHSGPVVFFSGPVAYLQNNNGLWPVDAGDVYSPADAGTCGSSSTLNGSINNSVTSLGVADASTFPNAPFQIYVDSEIMLVTAVSGTTFTVTRGYSGSAAGSHTNGATVFIPSLTLYADPQVPGLCRGTDDTAMLITTNDTWVDIPSGNPPSMETSGNYPPPQYADFLVNVCGYVTAVFSTPQTLASIYAAIGTTGGPYYFSPVQVRIAGNDAGYNSTTGFENLANCGPSSSTYPETMTFVNADGVGLAWVAEFHFVWRASPSEFPFAWQLQAIRNTGSGALTYSSATATISGYYWEQIHDGSV